MRMLNAKIVEVNFMQMLNTKIVEINFMQMLNTKLVQWTLGKYSTLS